MMMAGTLVSRYCLTVRGHKLELFPIDEENYSVIIDGDYEAPFAGFRAAHRNAVKRLADRDTFSDEVRSAASDLQNWAVESVDVFDPEGN